MEWMSALVGAAAGAITGLGGATLNWRISSARWEAKVDEKLLGLANQLTTHAEVNERDRTELLSELHDAVRSFQTAAVNVAAMSAEQAVVNKLTAETLKGIVTRQESMVMQLAEHQARLLRG